MITNGATYLVTRRCTQRLFLLRPDPVTNLICRYSVQYAAERTGVEVHAFSVMSDHWHGVVSDPEARLPEFLQIVHRLIAVATNAHLGRVENLWAVGQPNIVRLDHPDDILAKIAYMVVNPVAAGLVKDPRDWPGVITTQLGETIVAERPDVFFRKGGKMPARTKLVCTIPRQLQHLGTDAVVRRLRALVREEVRRARRMIRSQGRRFLGADGVRAMPIYRHATTPESIRKRQPSFASRDPDRRRALLHRMRVFRAAFRIAFEQWRAGHRDVRFPEGTYQMRVLHAVRSGPPPIGVATSPS